jgi:hypothetical protein
MIGRKADREKPISLNCAISRKADQKIRKADQPELRDFRLAGTETAFHRRSGQGSWTSQGLQRSDNRELVAR